LFQLGSLTSVQLNYYEGPNTPLFWGDSYNVKYSTDNIIYVRTLFVEQRGAMTSVFLWKVMQSQRVAMWS